MKKGKKKMRPTERIDNFVEKISFKTLAERWNIEEKVFNLIRGRSGKMKSSIITYWKKRPNLRFGQMLINLSLSPNKLKIWNDEEKDILLDQGYEPREVLYWECNYDKDRKKLPKTEWILIKDMSTDHIKVILEDVLIERKYTIADLYLDTLQIEYTERIKSR